MMKKPLLMAWSGGKDSALALREIISDDRYDIVSLLTTVTEGYDRISMHGVRRHLLDAQAASLGFPVDIIGIPPQASGGDYERAMGDAMARWRAGGVETVAFGDIHLPDVRKYREDNLRRAGMSAIFPLWDREPHRLASGFVEAGFKAVITCVDTRMLSSAFSGRELDSAFIEDLPAEVDPCGENGEYHSFVYDGPPFACPVDFRRGVRTLRDGRFMYTDLESR